jgi:hypothetical protein
VPPDKWPLLKLCTLKEPDLHTGKSPFLRDGKGNGKWTSAKKQQKNFWERAKKIPLPRAEGFTISLSGLSFFFLFYLLNQGIERFFKRNLERFARGLHKEIGPWHMHPYFGNFVLNGMFHIIQVENHIHFDDPVVILI